MTELIPIVGVLQVSAGPQRPHSQAQEMPRGDTCVGSASVVLPDGSPADLTGGALVLTVAGLFARELDFVDASAGTAGFDVATGDTFLGADDQDYPYDLLFVDSAGLYGPAGGRYQVVPPSPWRLSASLAADPPVVTLAPSQTVLAQGPPASTTASVLPSPGASQRGKIVTLLGGAGVADAAYVCLKHSDDSYSWVSFATAP